MIDTAEIQGLQKYAGMAAANGSLDIPPNGHIDGRIDTRPIAKTYKESADRERTRKKASRDREVTLIKEKMNEVLSKDSAALPL